MKIVFVQGGLGNQLFQYAFFQYLTKKNTKEKVYLDATAPFISKHGGFELKKIFPAVAQNKRILPYWKARIPFLLSDILKKVFKINLQTNVENPTGKTIWWKGHWQEYKYPEFVNEELAKDLRFLPIEDEQNKKVAELICTSNAVSIHVRRGDYQRPHFRPTFGDICTLDYYKEAVDYIQQKIIDPQFFVFSDDPQWVKENLPLTNAVYINWNTGKNNFRDMQLMSQCKHHIIANSSFSWWGAWLNPSTDKVVVAPAKWFHNHPADLVDKMLPPAWHRVGSMGPNVSLIVGMLTEQEAAAILQQRYGDFELLTNATLSNTDQRLKPATQKPVGNHVFQLTEEELPMFENKKYLENKLKNYFKTWNN